MKKILIIIKKFFAVIISFILSLFKKEKIEKTNRNININSKKASLEQNKIKDDSSNIYREDESNNNIKKINMIYEVEDIEKINDIKDKLYKMEYYLKKKINLDSVNELKLDLKNIKVNIEELEKKQIKKTNNKKDIKIHINDCKEIIKSIEKKLDSIIIENDQIKNNNIKEVILPLNHNDQNKNKIEKSKKTQINKKKNLSKELKKTNPEIDIIIDSMKSNIIIDKMILKEESKIETEIIKEYKEFIKKDMEEIPKEERLDFFNNIEVKDNDNDNEVQNSKDKAIKLKKNKNNNIVNKNEEINQNELDNIKKNKELIKESKKIDKMIQELNETILLTYEQKIGLFSNKNKFRTLIINILINNHIRAARNILSKGKKRIKLIDMNFKKEKLTETFIKNEINRIKNDTLKQIESIEQELKNSAEIGIDIEMFLEKIREIKENINETIENKQKNNKKLNKILIK